jgi:hypothetical protein
MKKQVSLATYVVASPDMAMPKFLKLKTGGCSGLCIRRGKANVKVFGIFCASIWCRRHDPNFRRFSAKNLAFSSKTNDVIKFLHN